MLSLIENRALCIADSEKMRLTNRHAVSIIGVMLCMAEEGEPGTPAPSTPFFRVDHVCKAIEGLAGKKDSAAAQQILQTQVSSQTRQAEEEILYLQAKGCLFCP